MLRGVVQSSIVAFGSVLAYTYFASRDEKRHVGGGGSSAADDARLRVLVDEAEAWALCNGLIMRDATGSAGAAPFSLLPFVVPASSYHDLCALCPPFNTLIDKYSRDFDFIQESLQQYVVDAVGYPTPPLLLVSRFDVFLLPLTVATL
jgi:hypothetical protein